MVRKIITFTFLIFLLVSCSSNKIEFKNLNLADNYENYRLDKIEYDYQADCKFLIKKNSHKQTGKCNLTLSADNKLRLSFLEPFGSVVLDLYIDKDIIQVINRYDKNYLISKNTKANREKYLGVDLKMEELGAVLWGREIIKTTDKLLFSYKSKRPNTVVKREGENLVKVRYSKWLSYKNFPFPKQIFINDYLRKTSLIFAMLRVRIGEASGMEPLNIPDGYHKLE